MELAHIRVVFEALEVTGALASSLLRVGVFFVSVYTELVTGFAPLSFMLSILDMFSVIIGDSGEELWIPDVLDIAVRPFLGILLELSLR